MGLSLNKLVYDLANLTRSGVTSDDDHLALRQIEFWVHNTRAKLIREDYNKGRTISDNVTQYLTCVEMEIVDASVACGIEVDCTVYKSTLQLPKAIETATEDLILRITPIAVGQKPFQMISMDRVPYLGFSPFSGINNSIKAAIEDRYAYLFVPKNDRVIKRINIDIVAEDPTDLARFCTCTGDACYTNDSDYPISAHMVETMKQMIINTNIKIITSTPTDSTGNANSDVQSNLTK